MITVSMSSSRKICTKSINNCSGLKYTRSCESRDLSVNFSIEKETLQISDVIYEKNEKSLLARSVIFFSGLIKKYLL